MSTFTLPDGFFSNTVEGSFTAEATSDELQFLGDSQCVASGKYVRGTLTVKFMDGSLYEYYSVHPFVWYNLLRATSKGSYFNRNIRPKGYAFSRLS